MRFHMRTHTPARITDARLSLSDDIRHRTRRYALTMGIRTACVILAIVLWQVSRVAAVVALVCGGVLPLIAVVYANAGRENPTEPPEIHIPGQAGPPPGPDSERPGARPDHPGGGG